jgi:hypothetical protein
MKVKNLFIALAGLLIASCSDNSGSLGFDMFPEGDLNISGNSISFDVTTQSVLDENVFAKTSVGYIGRFTDPEFGYYESGFLAEFHCQENFKFPSVCDPNDPADSLNTNALMVSDKIYRTELVLSYTEYFGDSLTASRMSVYQLNKALDKEAAYYTNINPKDYYSTSDLLGRKAYTAVDLSVKDSIRSLSTYVPAVTVTLPTELGQKIYDKSRECEKNGTDFANVFSDIIKGIYVKNDYGDGTILYIDQIALNVIYECYVRDSDTGALLKTYDEAADSTAYTYETFVATKEVIQANSFTTDKSAIQKKVSESNCTYIKTPAGIYTQATLPFEEFEQKLTGDTLNVVSLSFSNYNQLSNSSTSTSAFEMSAPDYVLLVREKDKDAFFKENKIVDNVTSYYAAHNNVSTNQYTFSNLAQLVIYCLAEKKAAVEELKNFGKISSVKGADGQPVTTIEQWMEATKWNKVAIIPVTVSTDSSGNLVSILNDLKPTYAKLKGGPTGSKLTMQVTYTTF